MGLAAYGGERSAAFEELMLANMLDLKEDGSIGLNMSFFDFPIGGRMYNEAAWRELLSVSPRQYGEPMTQEYKDIARAAQNIIEKAMMRLARHARELTGMKNLVMAGGVALNCTANGTLLRSELFDNIWIQPAAGDAGGALGAALAGHSISLGRERFRAASGQDAMRGSFLGPAFSKNDIEVVVKGSGARYTRYENFDLLCDDVAERLSRGEIVGWFQGSMEWGPRALGNRSILADPRNANMRDKINARIKHREQFRPFAPAVLAEDAHMYFEEARSSPYMLFNFSATAKGRGLLPAAIHVDGSARVQTVDERTHPRFHALLREFKKLTGCGALVNTSFNDRDEPIVCSPADALRSFRTLNLDCLVIGDIVLERTE